jgi:beta-lactamase class A
MHTFSQPSKGAVQKKVPLYFVLLAALAPTLLFFFLWLPHQQEMTGAASAVGGMDTGSENEGASMQQYRLQTYSLTKPLLLADLPLEDKEMSPLKSGINGIIEINKTQGNLASASVFLLRLNHDNWININPTERFSPGSMLKISVLIAYFKMLEKNPKLFEQKLYLAPGLNTNRTQHIDETHLPPGQYKIGDLIEAMIANSDNYATMLLNQHLDQALFINLYSDLGLRRPDMGETFYPMTAREFSRFLRVLHNATYLSPDNSESALELLTKANYDDGIVAGLPANTKVAHKFGESGDGKLFELHEAAIVYNNDDPYLLVVMTKGKDISRLPGILKEISTTVYNSIGAKPL